MASDKQLAGARRLARPSKGSTLRPFAIDDEGRVDGGYRSIVAWGGNAAGQSTSIADGAAGTITFTVSEEGYADHLCIMGNAAVALAAGTVVDPLGAYVTSLLHSNDSLTTGSVPATVFAHTSNVSPTFGHYFKENCVVTCAITNQSGATAEYGAAFTSR